MQGDQDERMGTGGTSTDISYGTQTVFPQSVILEGIWSATLSL